MGDGGSEGEVGESRVARGFGAMNFASVAVGVGAALAVAELMGGTGTWRSPPLPQR